jgi:GNAT superfamily N-acetyltransferase
VSSNARPGLSHGANRLSKESADSVSVRTEFVARGPPKGRRQSSPAHWVSADLSWSFQCKAITRSACNAGDDAPFRQYVALDGEDVVGRVRSVDATGATWCADMYVNPSHRRRGIGQALLSTMLRDDRARDSKCSVLTASHTGALLYPWGPSPVTNTNRRNGVESYDLIGDHTNLLLRPQAAEAVKKHGEIELSGVSAPGPRNLCWPGGVPFVFVFEEGMQMLQQPDKITIVYDFDHQVRRVRMNGPHPAADTVLVWGFRRPLGRRDAGDRHHRRQEWAVCYARRIGYAVHKLSACRGTLSANRLRRPRYNGRKGA